MGVNVVSFTWNTNTNTSSIFMNGIDILGNLSNTVDPGSLTNYQPKLTVTKTTASPLTLLNNVLTIDLTKYQPSLTVSSPFTLLNNTLAIDLSAYTKTTSLSNYFNSSNFVVGAGLILALKTSGVNIGKYELDFDIALSATTNSLVVTNGIKCGGLTLNAGLTSITGDSTGVSIYGRDVTISAASEASTLNFLNWSGAVMMGFTNTNIVINNNMTSYGTVDFQNGLNVAVSATITAANNNYVKIDSTGTKINGTCNIIGPLTCTGASIFNGTVSGTAITT